jgi:antitoxin component YwqK of YwqJK toxin-antitoxin module
MKKIIFVMLIPFLLVCCKSKNEHGDIVKKWKNGNTKSLLAYTNKAENSYVFTEYNEEGTLKSVVNYVNGKMDGSAKYFDKEGYLASEKKYRNGKLFSEYTYKYGKLSGPERIYHENGQLWTERILLNGRPWYVVSNFDSLGHKMDAGTLNEGYGTIILYDKNGRQLEVRHYRDGMQVIKTNEEPVNK